MTRVNRRRSVVLLGLGGSLGLLGGCGSSLLKPPPQPSLFSLDDGSPAPPAQPLRTGAATLLVGLPAAAPGFDSAHIVYLRRAQEIGYFASNQWVDAPARMLAPLLVRALERTGAFRAVLQAPAAAAADLRLDTELVRLQQDFRVTPSQVRLTLRAVLVDTATRAVVARREFDLSVAAASDDPYGGVVAGRLAAQGVLAELAQFCAAAAMR
jgi:cholesterol transport system auxiliary component